jgi:penicillin amidase
VQRPHGHNGGVRRWLKVLSWTGAVVVVLLVVGTVTAVWTVRRSFPQTDGSVILSGLDATVTVVRDSHGIPQVYADTSNDLFFGQGYVQAQDRFFQMDFRRHVTSGRLSEMFGRSALKTDMFVRTLGWQRVAEQEFALLSTDTRSYLEAFSDGVNAYLKDHQGSRLSLEYAALQVGGLDYAPDPWTPVDSLAWLKAMAWDLGGNMNDEISRSEESVRLSKAQIAQLYPSYPYRQNTPIVTQGALVDGVFEQDATKPGTRLPRRPPFLPKAAPSLRAAHSAGTALDGLLGTGDALGSNAWAVSGEHTATGAPILANDPHLAPSMPGVWYQMGLHCRQLTDECPYDVSGFTFAGLPGVVIGHNDDIAWGFTNLGPDVQDLYLEKIVGDNRYLYDGHRRRLATRRESFTIRGEDEPVTITVRASQDGPLISDVSSDLATVGADAPTPARPPARANGYAVALRWTALQPGRTADALFGFDRARNWDEFRDAARTFDAPSQNIVYADTAGHIGYQAPGLIPIRRTGLGDWPVPGWDPAYQWAASFVPFDALPSVLDPKGGYVVTANQAVTTPAYPYHLGDSFDYGYRSERIRSLLQHTSDLTVDDMASIQLDDYSVLAERLTPLLLSVKLPGGYYSQGQRLLGSWDYRQGAGSPAAAYFNVVWSRLLALTFDDQLPEDAWPDGGDRWWEVVMQLVKRPHDPFWDDVGTPRPETRDVIVKEAMADARDDLTRTQSRDPHAWEWGNLHTLTLRNQTLGSSSSPVAFLFNRGGYHLAGGGSLVDATSWDASDGYAATAVPSMRMVIPLDDLDAARWVNLTGESGHAFADTYTDQTDLWLDGDTLPWAFSDAAVRAAGTDTLSLEPPS